MVRSGKTGGGGYKNNCISETISPIELKLGQNVDEGVPYLYMCSCSWHHYISIGTTAPFDAFMHSGDAFWLLDSHFMHILPLRIGRC